MHRERVLELLRRSKSELQACFGVTGLALFGSTARDTATSTSDVDVLVAFDGRWSRFTVPDLADARSYARRRGIPCYDAPVVGYPRRMREFDQRRKQGRPD